MRHSCLFTLLTGLGETVKLSHITHAVSTLFLAWTWSPSQNAFSVECGSKTCDQRPPRDGRRSSLINPHRPPYTVRTQHLQIPPPTASRPVESARPCYRKLPGPLYGSYLIKDALHNRSASAGGDAGISRRVTSLLCSRASARARLLTGSKSVRSSCPRR